MDVKKYAQAVIALKYNAAVLNKAKNFGKGLFLLAFTSTAITDLQATNFTIAQSGDWNVASTWSYLSGPADADGIPDADDAVLGLSGGHTVTLTQNQDVGACLLSSGSILQIGQWTLTVDPNQTSGAFNKGTLGVSGLNSSISVSTGTINAHKVDVKESAQLALGTGTINTYELDLESSISSLVNGPAILSMENGTINVQHEVLVDKAILLSQVPSGTNHLNFVGPGVSGSYRIKLVNYASSSLPFTITSLSLKNLSVLGTGALTIEVSQLNIDEDFSVNTAGGASVFQSDGSKLTFTGTDCNLIGDDLDFKFLEFRSTSATGKLTLPSGKLYIEEVFRLEEGMIDANGGEVVIKKPLVEDATYSTTAALLVNTGKSLDFFDLTINNGGNTFPARLGGLVTVANNCKIETGILEIGGDALGAFSGTISGGTLVLKSSAVTDYATISKAAGATLTVITTPGEEGHVVYEKTLSNTNAGWRQMAFPLADDAPWSSLNPTGISLLWAGQGSPASQENMFNWDATDAGSSAATGWVKATDVQANRKNAFAIYLENDGVHDFSTTFSIEGNPFFGNYSQPIKFTEDPASPGNANGKGWNLVPNPWARLIDLNALVDDAGFTPTYKGVHVWDAISNQYKSFVKGVTPVNYNTNGGNSNVAALTTIAPFQAFWVKADADATLTLNETAVTTTDRTAQNTFMKQEPEGFQLHVFDQDNNWDGLKIYFDAQATREFDNTKDAYKLKSATAGMPTIYANEGNAAAQIVGRPISIADSVEVAYTSTKDQCNFSIEPDLANLSGGWYVYLKDRVSGKVYEMEAGKRLRFVHKTAYSPNRFVVYYSKNSFAFDNLVTGAEATTIAYVKNEQVTLQSRGYTGPAEVMVTDAVGRIIYRATHNLQAGDELPLELLQNGQLIVISIQLNDRVEATKLYY